MVGARAQAASGLGPGHRVVHCLNYRLWMGGYTDHTTLEATGAAVIPFGVGETQLLVRTIRELEDHGDLLHALLSGGAGAGHRRAFPGSPAARPRPALGLFGGEAGLDDPDFRRRLEATWGFTARNANYGVTDVFCNFAGQSELDNDLHFMALDVLHPELIDPDDRRRAALARGRARRAGADPCQPANASRWCASAPATSSC